jgi:hypothetical protein
MEQEPDQKGVSHVQQNVDYVEAGSVGITPEVRFEPVGGENQGVVLLSVAGEVAVAIGSGDLPERPDFDKVRESRVAQEAVLVDVSIIVPNEVSSNGGDIGD